jgi:lipoate-protein ligase A
VSLRRHLLEGLDPTPLSALPEAAALARKRSGGELAAVARPAKPTIVFGYQQSLSDLDLDACRKAGIGVGRRFCAGDAFLVGSGDVAFALATSQGEKWTYREAVGKALNSVVEAVRGLGADPKIARSSVLIGERRVAGATAVRKWGGHLVCGYVTLNGPLSVFAPALRLSARELSTNYVTMKEATGKDVAPERFAALLMDAWSKALTETGDSQAEGGELKELSALANGKYAGARWLSVR